MFPPRNGQRKRHRDLLARPETAWRVSGRERAFRKRYDDFLPVSERALRTTSTGQTPWTLVEGTDRRYRELHVGEHIRDAITRRMAKPVECPTPVPAEPAAHRNEPTILSVVDLSQKLERDAYAKRLDRAQARLAEASRRARAMSASAIVLFEGWDAAGKGGAVRRATAAMDARFYEIVPIAAPSDEERARPWLWRFWRRLPGEGRLTIFDRSWYGRVLVERVEGFATPDEWRRAYSEINDFEYRLCDHGYGLAKVWLHIDRDEQARRFAEREQTSYKRYKITEDDYRNREKWDLYEDAVNEMVERTSTEYAPWTIVPANDKRHARVEVVDTVREQITTAIERRKKS